MRWKHHDDTLSRFHTIPACDGQTDGRTDRQTDVQPISITCFSIADARKNERTNFNSPLHKTKVQYWSTQHQRPSDLFYGWRDSLTINMSEIVMHREVIEIVYGGIASNRLCVDSSGGLATSRALDSTFFMGPLLPGILAIVDIVVVRSRCRLASTGSSLTWPISSHHHHHHHHRHHLFTHGKITIHEYIKRIILQHVWPGLQGHSVTLTITQ